MDPDHTVRVEISMSWRFFEKWEAHLKKMGENNRSAWARRAIKMMMNEDEEDVGE